MNVLRRVAAQALRNPQMRGGAGGRTNPGGEIQWPNGSFWSEGTQEGLNGFKYGEIPPPPGQSRKWAWWEAPWYTFTILSYPLYYIMFFGKPLEAQGINYWGRPRAEEELETDHKLLDKLAADPELMARCRSCAEACGMIGDECYDLVFMRKEYMLQKKLHDGEWPQEVKDFLDELEA